MTRTRPRITLATLLLLTSFGSALAAPVAPPGYALEAVASALPDSGVGLAIAGAGFAPFAGQAFVSSYGLGKIWRVDSAGAVHDFASGLFLPSFLRFGPGGTWGADLYVSENIAGPGANHGRIVRFDAAGQWTDLGDPTPQDLQYGGGDIAFSESGDYGHAMYVGISAGLAGDGLSRFDPPAPAATVCVFAGVPGIGYAGFVGGLGFGPAISGWTGDLYLGLYDSYDVDPSGVPPGGLYRVDAAGNKIPVVTWDVDPRVHRLRSLEFGPGGAWGRDLYAGGSGTSLLRIQPDGTVADFVTGIAQLPTPVGLSIAFDDLQRLWFVEPGTATLWRITPSTLDVRPVRRTVVSLAASPSVAGSVTTLAWSLPGGGPGRLECFDAAGRRVRTWQLGGAAEGRVAWDRRDGAGARLADGLYFARLTGGGESVTARVLWIR